ncbi:MAG: adenylosuccinate synthase [Candidatus Velthaea sp.]
MIMLPHHPARPVDIVVGIQWGDEGKGRVVDLMARDYDIIARFGGGDNAGHSIEVGDVKLALRIVPSGALVPGARLFIGGGTVVSLRGFVDEVTTLANAGVDVSRISISDRAHIVFPYHAVLDRLNERDRGAGAIGTTGRGIGPAYVDRVGRMGITFGDLARPEHLAQKIRQAMLARASIFAGAADVPREEDVIAETLELREIVLPHVVDGISYIHDAMESGRRILAEGAQGTMLDVNYGSYPYVTSSSTIAGGAATGLGIGPRAVGNVAGIAKAYCTRVGGGPFPSELSDEMGERLRAQGREFGVVTGRPRRCGWFDAVAARYAARLNGLSHVILTKLDVLTGFERIGVVTGYRRGDGTPCGIEGIDDPDVRVDVRYYEGWAENIRDIRSIADLPAAARAYIDELSRFLEVPLALVSVGPERSAFARVS